MNLTWPPKDPDEVLDYSWRVPLDGGDTIAGAPTATVIAGTISIQPATTADGIVTVVISGGAAGEDAAVRMVAETAGGRTFEETFLLSIRDSALLPASVTLGQVKQHLHIYHDDDDGQLADLISQAEKALARYVGEVTDGDHAGDLVAAQIVWIRWRYYTDEAVELDEIHNLPRPFVALAGPYRTPTIA